MYVGVHAPVLEYTPVAVLNKMCVLMSACCWCAACLQAFVRAAEKHGRNELDKIAGEIEGKAKEEVVAYSKVRGGGFRVQGSGVRSAQSMSPCAAVWPHTGACNGQNTGEVGGPDGKHSNVCTACPCLSGPPLLTPFLPPPPPPHTHTHTPCRRCFGSATRSCQTGRR
jgi:hypothetical protein